MTSNLSDLIVEESAEDIEENALAVCQAEDLPTTSWFPDAVPTVLIKAFSSAGHSLWALVPEIAKGFIHGLSTGAWLDKVLASQYQETRTQAGFTYGTFLLVDNGGGPHSITTNVTRFRSQDRLYSYVALETKTLALDDTDTLAVRAETVGAAHNVPNSTPLEPITSMPTVTVTNPAVGTTGTWITILGVDQESDVAATARSGAKWATLSTGSPPNAYKKWALDTAGVTRAKVDDGNPGGPGTVWVYVDNSGSVAALQATLTANAPAGTLATAVAATTESVTIPAVLTVTKSARATAEAQATANLIAYAALVDIGGIVRKAQLTEEIMRPDGMVDCEIGSSWTGSPNLQLGPSAIPQFTLSFTWVEV